METTNPSTSSPNTEINGSTTPIKTVSIIDARDELECNTQSRVIVTETRNVEIPTPKITWSRLKGNVCASATGTVRVQSRRKSEMFSTCTNSCTREKMHAP